MLDYAALVADMVFVLNHVPVFQMALVLLHQHLTLQLLAMLIRMAPFAISLALTATVLRRTHACPQLLSIQTTKVLSRHCLHSTIL
jgi:hypothetical protein